MKKLFVIIIFMLLMPTIVLAKDNVLTINLYEYGRETDLPESVDAALQCAEQQNLIEHVETEYDDYYYFSVFDKESGKKIYEEECTYDGQCSRKEIFFDLFTEDDSIEFSNCGYYELNGYNDIIINYSNKKSDKKGVYLSRIKLIDKSIGTTINGINKEDLKLSFDTTYSDLNDYAKFKVLVNNNSNKEYQIDASEKYGKNNIIKYEFSFEDNSNLLKANSKKVLFVKASYTNEVPANLLINNVYKDTNVLDIILKNGDNIVNPKTSMFTLIVMLIVSIIFISIIIMIKVPRLRKKMTYILILTILIPGTVKALEMININVVDKVEVNKNPMFCITDYSPLNYVSAVSDCYRFTDGMTWEEWFASDYNTEQMNYTNVLDVVTISSDSAYCDKNFSILNALTLVDKNNNMINLTDEIQKNVYYHSVWKSWRHNYGLDTYTYIGDGASTC